ncbi:MAG: OsmC family protein [Candidatus Hydrogenedentes bacterium]|nr:OsmC family protein [Candidatus Hydrogenedentota bacterium]
MSHRQEYHTSVRWESQRKGEVSAPELSDLTVATPPHFPGGHGGIWSPENLFVASIESCIMTTFLAIAENSKLEFKEYRSMAEGIVEKTEGGYVFTEVTVKPVVVIGKEKDRDRTLRILNKSERACLVSRSVKTPIHLEPEAVVA